jgi:hypothetical protein
LFSDKTGNSDDAAIPQSLKLINFAHRETHMGIEEQKAKLPLSLNGRGSAGALAIVAGMLVAKQMKTADDFWWATQGSPRTDAMTAALVQ